MAKRASDSARRSVAAKLGWERKRAAAAKRSAASKRGWETRRKNAATRVLDEAYKKPGGKNLVKGKPVPYTPKKYGYAFKDTRGEPLRRYDFRGLTAPQRRAMIQQIVNAAVGRYMRALVVTSNPEAARRLYTGTWGAYAARHRDPTKPYYFWTELLGPIESSLEAFSELQQLVAGGGREVRIVLVEIL